jgi:hypothetical protein
MSGFFGTLFAAVFTLAFGWMAWAPWITPFSELKREVAVVQAVEAEPYGRTRTMFLTSSRVTLQCLSGKGRGCERELMRSLLDARTPVDLWHNGSKIYQLAVGGRVILPYERVHDGRGISFAIFVVLLMGWCVGGAMHFGLFSNYPRGS